MGYCTDGPHTWLVGAGKQRCHSALNGAVGRACQTAVWRCQCVAIANARHTSVTGLRTFPSSPLEGSREAPGARTVVPSCSEPSGCSSSRFMTSEALPMGASAPAALPLLMAALQDHGFPRAWRARALLRVCCLSTDICLCSAPALRIADALAVGTPSFAPTPGGCEQGDGHFAAQPRPAHGAMGCWLTWGIVGASRAPATRRKRE
jgi:hypothetical protein